jgi:hypothetical protein
MKGQVQGFGRPRLVLRMNLREGVGTRQFFRRIAHEMTVGRIRPRPVALMIQQDDEIRHVIRHDLQEPLLLAPFNLRAGPYVQAPVTIGYFLAKPLDLRFRII